MWPSLDCTKCCRSDGITHLVSVVTGALCIRYWYTALNIKSREDHNQSMLSGTLPPRAWCIDIFIVYLGLFTGAVSSSGSPFLCKLWPWKDGSLNVTMGASGSVSLMMPLKMTLILSLGVLSWCGVLFHSKFYDWILHLVLLLAVIVPASIIPTNVFTRLWKGI